MNANGVELNDCNFVSCFKSLNSIRISIVIVTIIVIIIIMKNFIDYVCILAISESVTITAVVEAMVTSLYFQIGLIEVIYLGINWRSFNFYLQILSSHNY